MPALSPAPFIRVTRKMISEPCRIIIAKSDQTYAESLNSICSRVFPDAEIQSFTKGGDALSELLNTQVEYIILGLSFADQDGIELLQQISQQRLANNVIVVAEQKDRPLLPCLHTMRIDAIIDTYTESINEVRNALRLVSKGQVYVSPALRPYLVERHSSQPLRQLLTPGELRVLRVIGDGSDNQQAAKTLGLSEATVQTHRRSIMLQAQGFNESQAGLRSTPVGLCAGRFKRFPARPTLIRVKRTDGPLTEYWVVAAGMKPSSFPLY